VERTLRAQEQKKESAKVSEPRRANGVRLVKRTMSRRFSVEAPRDPSMALMVAATGNGLND
jgi:hypothetical protein